MPKKKPVGTPLQRLTQAIGRSKAEPSLSSAVVHLLDRYLSGAPDLDDADRVVAEVLPRHGVDRATLAAFVADYKKVPEVVRAKVTPPELLKASVATPLSKTSRAPLVLSRKVPRLAVVERVGSAVAKPLTPPPAELAPSPPLEMKRPKLAHLGRLLKLRRLPEFPWPYLLDIEEPDGSYTWGDVITLEGLFPELTAATSGTYRAFSQVQYLDNEAIVTELPIVTRATGKLDVRLTTTRRGGWSPVVWVTRTVDGETHVSNQLALALEAPTPIEHHPVPTRIDSISPPGQFAGDRVFVTGLNLHTGPFEWDLVDAREDDKPLLLYPTKISNTEVEIRLPRAMMGGSYRVRCLGGFVTGVPSNIVGYDVGIHHFSIEPISLVCINETNPEGGADDTVLSYVVSGDHTHKGNTPEIDFDSGDRYDFPPGSLKMFTGNVDQVRLAMTASLTLTEWDEAEAQAAHQLVGAVAGIATALMPLLTAHPVALAIASIVAIAADLTAWILSWNGNNLIGHHFWDWHLNDLLALTANLAGSFTVAQDYVGDGGHYVLSFKVSRVVPAVIA